MGCRRLDRCVGSGRSDRLRRSVSVAGGGPGGEGAGVGEGAQREVHGGAGEEAGVPAHLQADPGDPRLQGEDPHAGALRRDRLQLLEGRRARTRDLEAHRAGVLQVGVASVGDGSRRGRAGEGRRQELGLPRGDVPRAGVCPLHDRPLAGRLGRRRAARVRHQGEAVRLRRLHPAGGQVERLLARPGHALDRDRFRRRLADELRLPALRQALEAGLGALLRQDHLRNEGRGRRGVWFDRDPLRRNVRHRLAGPGLLPPRDLSLPRRPPGEAGSPRGFPRAHALPRPRALLAPKRLGRGRQDLPRRVAARRHRGRHPSEGRPV